MKCHSGWHDLHFTVVTGLTAGIINGYNTVCQCVFLGYLIFSWQNLYPFSLMALCSLKINFMILALKSSVNKIICQFCCSNNWIKLPEIKSFRLFSVANQRQKTLSSVKVVLLVWQVPFSSVFLPLMILFLCSSCFANSKAGEYYWLKPNVLWNISW